MNAETNPVHEEALRLAREGDTFLAFEYLEQGEDPVKVAVNYAQIAQQAYGGGDIQGTISFSQAGIRYCSAQASQATDAEIASKLKDLAKIISFNLGTNTWPGWGESETELGSLEIAIGLDSARACLRLVEALELSPDQRGNAHWLVGAQSLALGRLADAIAAFERSAEAYGEGDEPLSVDLANGYRALAQKLEPATAATANHDFERIIAKLNDDDSEDAQFFAEQLTTADRVFAAGQYYGVATERCP